MSDIPKKGFFAEITDTKHNYWFDGARMYGITTILGKWDKGGLISWAANQAVDYIEGNQMLFESVDKKTGELDGNLKPLGNQVVVSKTILTEARTAHDKKRDKAGDRGKEVHKEVERYINFCIDFGGDATWDKDIITKENEEFAKWGIENKVKFLSSEQVLHSKKMFTAGTADFTCEIDGKKFLGDLKTGKSIQTTAFYQCAGYILMAEEQGEKFDGIIVVHVPAKGELKEYRRFDLESDKAAFLGILKAYQIDKTYKL